MHRVYKAHGWEFLKKQDTWPLPLDVATKPWEGWGLSWEAEVACRSPNTWQIVGPMHCETVLSALQTPSGRSFPSHQLLDSGEPNQRSTARTVTVWSQRKLQEAHISLRTSPYQWGSWGTKLRRNQHEITQPLSRSARHVFWPAFTAGSRTAPPHLPFIHCLRAVTIVQFTDELATSNLPCFWQDLSMVKLSRASGIQIIVLITMIPKAPCVRCLNNSVGANIYQVSAVSGNMR